MSRGGNIQGVVHLQNQKLVATDCPCGIWCIVFTFPSGIFCRGVSGFVTLVVLVVFKAMDQPLVPCMSAHFFGKCILISWTACLIKWRIVVFITLKAIIMGSPIINCIRVNLIGIYWFQCWIRLQNEVVMISTTHYLTNWIVNAGQCCERSGATDWLGSHPSCCHFGWSLPSRFTAQWLMCILLSHFAFSINLWEHHAA